MLAEPNLRFSLFTVFRWMTLLIVIVGAAQVYAEFVPAKKRSAVRLTIAAWAGGLVIGAGLLQGFQAYRAGRYGGVILSRTPPRCAGAGPQELAYVMLIGSFIGLGSLVFQSQLHRPPAFSTSAFHSRGRRRDGTGMDVSSFNG